jgi:hypothetical protein
MSKRKKDAWAGATVGSPVVLGMREHHGHGKDRREEEEGRKLEGGH